MTKLKKEPERIVRMRLNINAIFTHLFLKSNRSVTIIRKRFNRLQKEQEDRRVLLQQILEAEEREEELRNAVQHNWMNECQQLLHQGISVNHRDLAGCKNINK